MNFAGQGKRRDQATQDQIGALHPNYLGVTHYLSTGLRTGLRIRLHIVLLVCLRIATNPNSQLAEFADGRAHSSSTHDAAIDAMDVPRPGKGLGVAQKDFD